MLVSNTYHQEYYLKNTEKVKSNFQRWYAKPENKEKMKVYMREWMRKKKGIKKKDFRIK